MKRAFDLFAGVILLLSLVIILLFIAIAIRRTSKGSVLYWSDRIGKNNKIFKMPKFRSMLIDTPAVATHWCNIIVIVGDYITIHCYCN